MYSTSKKEIVVGKTTYIVNCYCSLTKEEIKAKIAHLIKNETKKNKA